MKVFIFRLVTLLLVVKYGRSQTFRNTFPESSYHGKQQKRFTKSANEKLNHQNQSIPLDDHPTVDAAVIMYSYHESIGIPEAERIRKYESEYRHRRMILGTPSALGQQPYQGGLVITLLQRDETSICGCCLLSRNRALTAAHCWSDRGYQASSFEVVLGSTKLYSGGVRVKTSDVTVHKLYNPETSENDIAMIRFRPIAISKTILPIALPSNKEVDNDWVGWRAVASGYGVTEKGTIAEELMHAYSLILSNVACWWTFYSKGCEECATSLRDTSICTSDRYGAGPYNGDSGGPLAVRHKNKMVLVGVVSFGAERNPPNYVIPNLPNVYTRVSKYIGWIRKQM